MKEKDKMDMLIESTLNEFFNEDLGEKTPEIEINKIENDERSNRKPINKYRVNYQITLNGKLVEIEGELIPYNTGRSEEFSFEPSYFTDSDTEFYYNENWEKIESEVLNKLSNEI